MSITPSKTLLERFERQAVHLGYDPYPDLQELVQEERLDWSRRNAQIQASGDPTALIGGFAGPEVNPTVVNEATVTGGATELAIIPTARAPIVANPQIPKVYRLFVSGTSTTAATPGTYTLAARIGPAPTNASPLFGAVSGALTPVASATAAQWRMTGFVLIRTGGTAAVAVGSFDFNHSATIGGGGPVTATGNAIFGGVSATFDSTLTTTALWMGVTHATSTTNTWVPQAIFWGSWN